MVKKFASSLLYKYIVDLYASNTGKRFHVKIFIDRDLFKIKIFSTTALCGYSFGSISSERMQRYECNMA